MICHLTLRYPSVSESVPIETANDDMIASWCLITFTPQPSNHLQRHDHNLVPYSTTFYIYNSLSSTADDMIASWSLTFQPSTSSTILYPARCRLLREVPFDVHVHYDGAWLRDYFYIETP